MIWHTADSNVPTYEMWKKDNPKRTWGEYCHACFNPKEHENDPTAPKASAPPHTFTYFDDGTPVLPPLEAFRHSKDMVVVMHTFLSLHWGTTSLHDPLNQYAQSKAWAESASGIKGLPVAWKAVAKNPGRFLSPELLPDGLALQNPHRMSGSSVKMLWKHILELQTGSTVEERFHWTHWWERLGQAEDSGKIRDVSYGKPPQPKHIAMGRTGKKSRRPRAKRVPPKGAFGIDRHEREECSEEEPAESVGEDVQSGSRKERKGRGKLTKKARRKKEVEKSDAIGKGKGKGKHSGESEASAVSSDASSDTDDAVGLEPDDDSPDSEDFFDLDVSGSESETRLGVTDAPRNHRLHKLGDPKSSSSASRVVVPPQTVKPRPVRRTQGTVMADEPSDATPAPEPNRTVIGPWDDVPLGPKGLATVRIPPRTTHVKAADGQAPSWISNEPELVFPFLWSLCSESDYRAFLASWQHMVSLS